MSMNRMKSRAYVAATTTVATALALYAFAAPFNVPH